MGRRVANEQADDIKEQIRTLKEHYGKVKLLFHVLSY